MSDDNFIRIVNWSEFQHYKKRDPPWIKLYRRVLTDYEITGLDPWERWCLVGLWLLAAETNNRIPPDPDWLRARLVVDKDPPIAKLEDLGLIEVGASARKMIAKGYTKERREETEKRQSREEIGAKAPLSNGGRSTAEWMHETWQEVFGNEAHPLDLTASRKQKYEAMYAEQLEGTPDPKAAWRAVLYAVTKSSHHMSKRSYQMPESILRNADRRSRWVQEAIDVLERGPTEADRKLRQKQDEVLDFLRNGRAA